MDVVRTSDGYGLGWLPDLPDHRDFNPGEGKRDAPQVVDDVPTLLARVGVTDAQSQPASEVDMRDRFSPIEDQGALGSCTANAAVGLLEYFELNAHGRYVDASRLFLYKATRNLMGVTGDTGAFLRTTMQALAIFGAPPEEHVLYDIARFDDEPPAFAYSFGQAYQALQYYRLDPPSTSRDALLDRIKANLNARLPSMFGFTVFASYTQARTRGEIPFPGASERRVGGHAVVAAGYNDEKTITHAVTEETTTGAILIRNSWGADWGDGGYGWLPYLYVAKGLAVDWWSLIESSWVDSQAFG